jgi:uncharacterized protein (TIGR03437 family)
MAFMRLCALLTVLTASAFAQPKYTITDLGTNPTLDGCIATSISPNGTIAGYCHLSGQSPNSGASQGFIYSGGKMTMLASASGPQVAVGVNDDGTVIGVAAPQGQTFSGALFTGGTSGFFAKGAGSPTNFQQYFWPAGINASGQVAGIQVLSLSTSSLSFAQGAIYSPSTGKYTQVPGDAANSLALSINKRGDTAGLTFILNLFAFSLSLTGEEWVGSTASVLPPPSGGGNGSAATSVNDQDVSVGASFTSALSLGDDPLTDVSFSNLRAVIWKNLVPTDLNAIIGSRFSLAEGVNNSGAVVGLKGDISPGSFGPVDLLLYTDSPSYRAFLYDGVKAYDLNNQVNNIGNWILTTATAINDAGQIVGAGFINGKEHAFLLTPASTTPSGPAISAITGAGNSSPLVNTISANGYFTIYGSGFVTAGTLRNLSGTDIVNGTLPTNLASTCVNVANSRAFITYVSPAQINVLAPALPTSGPVSVNVVSNCATGTETPTPSVNVNTAPASPEFLYWMSNGQNPIIALDTATGTFIDFPSFNPSARAVKAGDVLTLFGVGFGKTTSGQIPGNVATAADTVTGSPSITIGGKPAISSYVGVTPTFAGLYQVNVTVPSGLTPGNNAVVLTVNGASTPAGGFLLTN